MKALSLWQPWATLWASGLKEYETRSWPTRYRGLLAVHATTTLRPEARDLCFEYPEFGRAFDELDTSLVDLPLGAVLGIVEIVGCIRTIDALPMISEREETFGNYGPGRYAIRAKVVEIFDRPIPAKGAQGFWEWTPPLVYRLTGSDLDFIHFSTASTSRVGVAHDLAVDKRTGAIVCTCEDARCRRKEGDILRPERPACKHVEGLHREWRRLAEEARVGG